MAVKPLLIPLPDFSVGGVDPDPFAGLGILHPDQSHIRNLCLPLIKNLHGNQIMLLVSDFDSILEPFVQKVGE